MGSSERRPSAKNIENKNAKKMPNNDKISVTGKPPHKPIRTVLRPKMPPYNKMALSTKTLAHRPIRKRRQCCQCQNFQTPEIPNAKRTDRKSTRLNSSHVAISYAVFCLKK